MIPLICHAFFKATNGSQAAAVEKQYRAAKQRLDRLSQSLLAKAFRGELVPQDPTDEPAAELLKRIQAERQAQTPAKHPQTLPLGASYAHG